MCYLEENDFFGELALLGIGKRSANAETLTDSELYLIEKNDFIRLLKNNSTVSYNLIHILAKRLAQTDKEIELLVFQDVFRRIIKILLNLSKKYVKITPAGRQINMQLTSMDIAELAGTVRETATRVISKLKKLKCIDYTNKYITILDEDRLKFFIK